MIMDATKFFVIISILFASCEQNKSVDIDKILAHNVSKVSATMNSLGDSFRYPRNIEKGQTEWHTKGGRNWTNGFWPGMLWYSYEYTGDESFKIQAEKFTDPLKSIAYAPARTHDIGFMIYCSFGNGYRLTGNAAYKKIMLAAADTLATLYNPNVGTILSWPRNKRYQHNTIIDNMMNLELLFWASKNGGSKNLHDIAVKHAETTLKTLVRPDFSTYHVAVFDTLSWQFLKAVTHQGYADDSQWARGQAWGIYGYAMCFRETGRENFLSTAQKLADVFIERLPEDGVPYWDFDDPMIPDAPKDASAAAVAACGMLQLAESSSDQKLVIKYKKAAISIIEKLSSEEYQSGDLNQAILLHSTGNHPKGSEIDTPIIYADYYFMEALLRLRSISEL